MSLSEQGLSPTGSNAHTASTGKILESDRRSCPVQKVASSYVSGSVRLKRGSVEQRGYVRDRRGSNFTELNCVYRQIEGYRRKKKKTHTRISKATTECRLAPRHDKCHKQSLLSYMEFMFKGPQRCHVMPQNSFAFACTLLHDLMYIFITYRILLVLYYNH